MELVNKVITVLLVPELMNGETSMEVEAECMGCLAFHPSIKSSIGSFTVTHVPTGLTLVRDMSRHFCLGFMVDVLSKVKNIDAVTPDDIKNKNPDFYALAELVYGFNDEEHKLDSW